MTSDDVAKGDTAVSGGGDAAAGAAGRGDLVNRVLGRVIDGGTER